MKIINHPRAANFSRREPRHATADLNFELFGIGDDGEARRLNVDDIGSAPVVSIIPGRMTRAMITRLSLLHHH